MIMLYVCMYCLIGPVRRRFAFDFDDWVNLKYLLVGSTVLCYISLS